MAKEKYSYGYAQEKYKPLKCKEEQYNLKLKRDPGIECVGSLLLHRKMSVRKFLSIEITE